MFEAAKVGASPQRLANLEAAIDYIAGTPTHAGEVRPWIRNVETKAFVNIGGRVKPRNGVPRRSRRGCSNAPGARRSATRRLGRA
ncbi:hypothetical protein AWB81_07207 [Caballeronia arationis]|jgi:hypothetical protein|nr:hypothetical protein AWB81_07207 [Caballeronia arationis]